MEHWLETSVLPAALAAGLLLLVLWPTRHGGRRVLQRWGVPDPSAEQVTSAVRYLRHRRVLYVAAFLALPSLSGLVLDDDRLSGIAVTVPLLVAMLVAEAVATLRPVSGVRTASLDPRGWRDLVPRWAVRTLAGGAVLTAAVAVVVADWVALGYVVACLLLVAGLVALAVRRPSADDEVVDAALRTRTARVAVGIGFGWLGIAFSDAAWALRSARAQPEALAEVLDIAGFVVAFCAIVCWLWVAAPSRPSTVATG